MLCLVSMTPSLFRQGDNMRAIYPTSICGFTYLTNIKESQTFLPPTMEKKCLHFVGGILDRSTDLGAWGPNSKYEREM